MIICGFISSLDELVYELHIFLCKILLVAFFFFLLVLRYFVYLSPAIVGKRFLKGVEHSTSWDVVLSDILYVCFDERAKKK